MKDIRFVGTWEIIVNRDNYEVLDFINENLEVYNNFPNITVERIKLNRSMNFLTKKVFKFTFKGDAMAILKLKERMPHFDEDTSMSKTPPYFSLTFRNKPIELFQNSFTETKMQKIQKKNILRIRDNMTDLNQYNKYGKDLHQVFLADIIISKKSATEFIFFKNIIREKTKAIVYEYFQNIIKETAFLEDCKIN